MTDNKEREAFEAWAIEKTFNIKRHECALHYAQHRTQLLWQAWRDGRAALAASQEKVEPVAWISTNRVSGAAVLGRSPIGSDHDETLWANVPLYAAPVAAHADMRECRHCGWMCAPNDATSKRWYPLAEPVAAQACPVCANGSLAPMSEDVAGRQFQFSVCDDCGSEVTNAEQSRSNVNAAPVAAQASEPAAPQVFVYGKWWTLHPTPQPSEPDDRGGYRNGFSDGAIVMADELKQLCKDFSDRQDRPYMGDVYAQVDALCRQVACTAPVAPQPSAEAVRNAALEEAANAMFDLNSSTDAFCKQNVVDLVIDAIRALKSAPPQHAEQLTFQDRVQPWMQECFGAEIAADTHERNHRFLEEAIELVQACGCTSSEAHQLVDYVFGRPVGDKSQEVGGVMVTLSALCLAQGMDMHAAGETELARIWTKVEQIRAKQAAKPKHSPLPEQPSASPAALFESGYALTDEEITKLAESMPGGLEGFLKGWGWQNFARAVESEVMLAIARAQGEQA